MQLLGIDYGTKKSGIAIGTGRVAIPMRIVKTGDLIQTMQALVKERGIAKIVIGLPLHVDGRESEHSRRTKRFAKSLRNAVPESVGIVFHDERYSSFEAADAFESVGETGKDPKMLDDVAAAIILQGYMDSNK